MALTELAGISVFVALTFQSLVILGESVITSEADKRTNNFRVPVAMPFDPNFWPSRGRRGRHPERVIRDICDALDRDFLLDRRALRCPAPELPEGESDKWKWPLVDGESKAKEAPGGCSKLGGDCDDEGGFPNPQKPSKRLPDDLGGDVLLGSKRFGQLRNKKRRQLGLPKFILYWNHENPLGEKKKKEDVFWVSRGKKNFYGP